MAKIGAKLTFVSSGTSQVVISVPATAAGYGLALAVAAGITRVMSSPAAQRFLPAWLRTTPDAGGDPK